MLGTLNQHVPMILFDPTCATAWWSLMHRFLSVKEIHLIVIDWTLIHILENTVARNMKFGHSMDISDRLVVPRLSTCKYCLRKGRSAHINVKLYF